MSTLVKYWIVFLGIIYIIAGVMDKFYGNVKFNYSFAFGVILIAIAGIIDAIENQKPNK